MYVYCECISDHSPPVPPISVLTQQTGDEPKRHDDAADEQVGHGQRQQEVVGDALQRLLQTDGQADEHVAHDAGHDEQQHGQVGEVEAGGRHSVPVATDGRHVHRRRRRRGHLRELRARRRRRRHCRPAAAAATWGGLGPSEGRRSGQGAGGGGGHTAGVGSDGVVTDSEGTNTHAGSRRSH